MWLIAGRIGCPPIGPSALEEATFLCDVLKPQMEKVRGTVDRAEGCWAAAITKKRPTRPTQAFLASERPRRTPNIFKHPNGVVIVRRVCQQWQKTSETETYINLKGMVGLAYVWQLRFDGCGSVSIPILRDYAPWIPADRMMWQGARHGISCDIPMGPVSAAEALFPPFWRASHEGFLAASC